MEQSPSSEANSSSANQEIPAFYGTGSLLPCSQELATGTYPEPNEPRPGLHTVFI
jgi:hypothetical protein